MIQFIFRVIGAIGHKYVDWKLSRDPEYQALERGIEEDRKEIRKIKEKYKDDPYFASVTFDEDDR